MGEYKYFDAATFAVELAVEAFMPEGMETEDACHVMASVIGIYLGLSKMNGTTDEMIDKMVASLTKTIKESAAATADDVIESIGVVESIGTETIQ
jgi:predicted RNA-binding protein with PIN domain